MFKEHSYSEWNLDTISWIVFRVYASSDFVTAKSRSLHLRPSYTRACVPRLVAYFPSCMLYIRITCDAPFTCECARASIYMHNSRTYSCFLHALHTRVCADDELWRPIESHRRHRSLSAWLPTRVPSFRNNLFVKAFGYAWKKCVFLRLILIRFPLRSYSAVMFNGIESWILRIIPEDMACHAPKDFNYDKIDLHSFSYINFCVLCKYVQLAKSEWQTVEVGGESGQRHARMTRGLHARGTRVAVLPRV